MLVEVRAGQVGDLQGTPVECRPSDERRVRPDPHLAQRLQELVAAAEGGADGERLVALVELHDRAAVGAGHPHGVLYDAAEHLVQVEAGGDRVADLAEGLELGHLRLERAAQLDLAQHDRGLRRERHQDVLLLLVERVDLGPPHRQHADDRVVEEHRCRHQGAEPGELLEVETSVRRVVQHVDDLLGAAVLHDPADQTAAIQADGVVDDVAPERLADVADHALGAYAVTLDDVELGRLGVQQVQGPVDDGVEHQRWVRAGTAQGDEDLPARGRLLACPEQLPRQTALGRGVLVGHSPHLRRPAVPSGQSSPARAVGTMTRSGDMTRTPGAQANGLSVALLPGIFASSSRPCAAYLCSTSTS